MATATLKIVTAAVRKALVLKVFENIKANASMGTTLVESFAAQGIVDWEIAKDIAAEACTMYYDGIEYKLNRTKDMAFDTKHPRYEAARKELQRIHAYFMDEPANGKAAKGRTAIEKLYAAAVTAEKNGVTKAAARKAFDKVWG